MAVILSKSMVSRLQEAIRLSLIMVLVARSAMIRFHAQTLGISVRATKDIEPGEEIQISCMFNHTPPISPPVLRTSISFSSTFHQPQNTLYLSLPIILSRAKNPDIPLGMRQALRAQALRNWGFDCKCSLCTAPLAIREASDARRLRLVDIQHTFSAMKSNQVRVTYNEARSLSEEIVQIAKTERLTTIMVQIYQGLTRLWYEIGDYQEAARYARRAVEFYETYGDLDTEFYKGLRRNLKTLQKWIDTI